LADQRFKEDPVSSPGRCGVSLIAVGAVSSLGTVMVTLGVGGLVAAVAEVGSITLVQRHAPTIAGSACSA